MAFKIRHLLTPEQIARIDATAQEIERIYLLPDRWLAEELLRLARATREAFPEKLKDPNGIVYDSNFVWHVVPEVAKRLGATRFRTNEATDPEVTSLSDDELRQTCGVYLQHVVIGRWGTDHSRVVPGPGEILTREIANGNPVGFAVDRLAPAPEPGQDRGDYIARTIREISGRRGYQETPYWTPELQNWRRRGQEIGRDMVADAPRLGM